MNHGYDDEDDGDQGGYGQAGPAPGARGFLASLLGGHGFHPTAAPARAYDDYFKAYSVAIMGKERPQLSYGGKIIMPPSALAKLTNLEIEGPWCFQLRNPRDPSTLRTHAGVLEFIAEEGLVYLPYWMMKTLKLNEGDPIRLTGSELPKGKMVKIQAQTVDFIDVTDPKAVLESALRSYSALTRGDIIEISYNCLTFEFLIMETTPGGEGIGIIDTDLEVDFETPKGYVEPKRPDPVAVPTMADKLKIDLGSTTPASAGSSRPASSTGSNSAVPDGEFESFRGMGNSLNGRKTKGKGKAKKVEEVEEGSKIVRTDKARIVTNTSLADDGRIVPAALHLSEGKYFFGFTYKPFDPTKEAKKEDLEAPKPATAFTGQGSTLSNRQPPTASSSSTVAPAAEPAAAPEKKDPWADLGSGATLSSKKPAKVEATEAPAALQSAHAHEIVDMSSMDDDDDWGYGEEADDEDDVIVIDSD